MPRSVFVLSAVVSIVQLFVAIPCRAQSATPPRPAEVPGQRADGSVLLPNQWSLRPAGRQIVLGDFPLNVAIHPDGRHAAVLHCGWGQHEIAIVDLEKNEPVTRQKIPEAFYGIAFSADGTRLFCSGASFEVVRVFPFDDGKLGVEEQIALRSVKQRGIPAGIALSRDGRNLYVANVWGQRVTKIDAANKRVEWDIPLMDPTKIPTGLPPAPSPNADIAAAEKRALALLDTALGKGAPFPYACVLDEKRQRLYVSLWGEAAVAVLDTERGGVIARWPTQEHPNEMLLTASGSHLLVANASRNTVTVFDADDGKVLEMLSASLYPSVPPGSTPNSLAVSPDGKRLFVANADNNNVAVFDFETPGRSHSLGFIPVGWYPTSVRVTPDGKRLVVANGKGIISAANPKGPQPNKPTPKGTTLPEYIGGLFKGTLGIVELERGDNFDRQMKKFTAEAYRCSPLKANLSVTTPRPEGNAIPLKPGDPSPIKYCIYVIKENRTYDQVLGDIPEGNGDPSLCLFPERITPNHHKIAREFVLLDNFYVNAEVSADGHEWSMGAYATDFVEKMWPFTYGHSKSGKFPFPAEGRFDAAKPAGGYIWDRAREAGVSYRSYGEFVDNGKTIDEPATSRVPALDGHFDPWYRGFDMAYPDTKRVERFASELKRFEAEGDMPRLQIVRLPNDHTLGTAAGKPTPTAFMGDNDLAFGRFVEAVSHSKFWPHTAIFVVEDDAQNGPDHVDAHRTIAFVVSPYTRRRAVDSTMYSTSSMLRTIELILGLAPMSQFDAAATPMYASFQAQTDLRPYDAVPVAVDLDETNAKTAWGAGESARMNFAKEDAADDLLLNEVIWRSIRGAESPMPPPVRAAFVFGRDEDDDE